MKLCAYVLLIINNLISIYICTVFYFFAKKHLQMKVQRAVAGHENLPK